MTGQAQSADRKLDLIIAIITQSSCLTHPFFLYLRPKNSLQINVHIDMDTEICGYCGGCVVVCHDEAIELAEVRLTI